MGMHKRSSRGGTSLAVQQLRLHLPMQGVGVQSLVRELRSHMPHSQKKKKRQNIKQNNIGTNSIKTLKNDPRQKKLHKNSFKDEEGAQSQLQGMVGKNNKFVSSLHSTGSNQINQKFTLGNQASGVSRTNSIRQDKVKKKPNQTMAGVLPLAAVTIILSSSLVRKHGSPISKVTDVALEPLNPISIVLTM